MTELSRLRWLCRRGMKELDVVLTRYLDNFYTDASQDEQHSFNSLLEMPDPDLFALLVGRKTSEDNDITNLIGVLKGMVKQA